jgi:A/G-specific adenine glycosylase
MRVLTRLEGMDGNPRERSTNQALWDLSERMVKQATAVGRDEHIERPASTFNQALMELGALICTPRQPVCTACPVAKNCAALGEGRVEELPANGRRVAATQRRFAAFVVRRNDKWLVRQRPAGVVNSHLWEFPNVETSNTRLKLKQAARLALGFTPDSMVPMLSLKHSITRYRITLDVYHTCPKPGRFVNKCQGNWLSLDDLNALPFTGSHRKILTLLHPD